MNTVRFKSPQAILISGLLIILVAAVGFFIFNSSSSKDSETLKKQALHYLIQKGEEAFKKDGEVTVNGLCVFMSMSASYRETVSDPTWEFKCFDSDTAYAAELRLNKDAYLCADSSGNEIEAPTSVIYGPECLKADDPRLKEEMPEFSTTMKFVSSTTTDVHPVKSKTTDPITKTGTNLQTQFTLDCGKISVGPHEDGFEKGRAGLVCLEEAFLDNCRTSSFALVSSDAEIYNKIYAIGRNTNNACTFSYIENGFKTRCEMEKVLNYQLADRYNQERKTLDEWTRIESPKYKAHADGLVYEVKNQIDALRILFDMEQSDQRTKFQEDAREYAGCEFYETPTH